MPQKDSWPRRGGGIRRSILAPPSFRASMASQKAALPTSSARPSLCISSPKRSRQQSRGFWPSLSPAASFIWADGWPKALTDGTSTGVSMRPSTRNGCYVPWQQLRCCWTNKLAACHQASWSGASSQESKVPKIKGTVHAGAPLRSFVGPFRAGFRVSLWSRVPRDRDDGFSLELSGPTPSRERLTVRAPFAPPPNQPYRCAVRNWPTDIAANHREAVTNRDRRPLGR